METINQKVQCQKKNNFDNFSLLNRRAVQNGQFYFPRHSKLLNFFSHCSNFMKIDIRNSLYMTNIFSPNTYSLLACKTTHYISKFMFV